jgi:hypothetical protein
MTLQNTVDYLIDLLIFELKYWDYSLQLKV